MSDLASPRKIEQASPTEMRIDWTSGDQFAVPFFELRFLCPCASCVDEHTGERTLKRESVAQDIRPKDVNVVGNYAIQIRWSDRHDTGMYHFDRLLEICRKLGRKL